MKRCPPPKHRVPSFPESEGLAIEITRLRNLDLRGLRGRRHDRDGRRGNRARREFAAPE